jgi:uncharacterized protein
MRNIWQQIKNPILTAVFVLAGLFIWSNFSYFLPFGAHPVNKDALFTADGTGEISYVPDTALLYLGVNKRAATQEEAKNQANEVINKIVEDLVKLGIDKKFIKTTNFSVNEDYSYGEVVTLEAQPAIAEDKSFPIRPNTPKIRGYVASANLEVRVKPLEKADQAIDIATRAGATQVGTSQLTLGEEEQKKLEGEARLQAIEKAKQKAKEISKAAGIRLGRVVSVQENGGGYPGPYMMKAEGRAADSGAAVPPTQLEAGENKLSVTVTLSYETY